MIRYLRLMLGSSSRKICKASGIHINYQFVSGQKARCASGGNPAALFRSAENNDFWHLRGAQAEVKVPNARHANHKTGILSTSDAARPLVLALEVSFNSGIGHSKSVLLRPFGRSPQYFMPVEKHLGISCEAVAKAEI